MAYAGNGDITTLRFLAANVIYQATQGLLNAQDEKDTDILNDAVLMMDVISSYLTEQDPIFATEWAAIQRDRNDRSKAPYASGEDRDQDQAFRWRELRTQFRSLCRKNQFVQHASASVEWKAEP